MQDVDVLIAGGGPAGAAAAIALARAGASCALIERRAAPVSKIGETLAPESRQLLQTLGVWDAFLRDGHLPSPGVRAAWGSAEPADKDFVFNPHGCAWQLDRARFEAQLLDAASAAGAEILRGAAWKNLRRCAGVWEVEAAGKKWRTKWVLDATGRAAALARRAGARRKIADRLVAIFALAAPGKSAADARTWVESAPQGWWYSALIPDGRRVFSFQTDADLLPEAKWRETKWLRARLAETRHMRSLLFSRARFLGAPRLTSAHSGRLDACAGDGWLAAGDAAQSFDPLSGEGLFHALHTGRLAAQAVSRALGGASDAAEKYRAHADALWRRFWRQREAIYALETRWPDAPFWRRRVVTA